MIELIGTALAILLVIFKWIGDHYSVKAKAYDAIQKEITDAIASGDNSRINAIVDKLRIK